MYRSNKELITEIEATKTKLQELMDERLEHIKVMHEHGISGNRIAKELNMKQQNVSLIIKSF